MESIFKIPLPVKEKIDQLNLIVEKHPEYIPLPEVAAFLGTKPDGLRASMDQGRCPFGFGWKINVNGNRAYKIPTVKFYLWYMNLSATA